MSSATEKTLQRPRGRWPVVSLLRTWFTAGHAELRYGSDRGRRLIAPQPEPPLRIRIERLPEREYAAVFGQLDIYTSPSLEPAVLELEKAMPLLVTDLTGRTFTDAPARPALLRPTNPPP